MKKAIVATIAMLLLCVWVGLFIGLIDSVRPTNGHLKTIDIAFIMIETPLMIFLLGIVAFAITALWRTHAK